jgi:anti-sigma-K factor RskA
MNDARDLAAVEALGTSSPEDTARLEAELERDPVLARNLDEYRETVSILEATVARERPRRDLFDDILAEIEPEPSPATAQRGRWPTFGWRRALPAFAVGAAAAAAVFAIALALSADDSLGTPDGIAAVQGTPEFTGVHGEARIYGSAKSSGVLRLELADVPQPRAGEHYEVWVLRPSAGQAMEAVGVFMPTGPTVDLHLGLPGAGDYAAVDISVEPDAGPPEHSGTSLASGRFEPGTT